VTCNRVFKIEMAKTDVFPIASLAKGRPHSLQIPGDEMDSATWAADNTGLPSGGHGTSRAPNDLILGRCAVWWRPLITKLGDVGLVIIDPVDAYIGANVDSHKNAAVRAVLRRAAHRVWPRWRTRCRATSRPSPSWSTTMMMVGAMPACCASGSLFSGS
jgi:hypothetical protein